VRKLPKEILLLLLLLLLGIGGVSWYVANRRAHPPAPVAASVPAPAPAGYVELTKHDQQTIDFSSGKPVVKDSPQERAELAAAEKELAEATKDVTFGPPLRKPATPPPDPPRN
jgi:hypothetical protein